MTRIACLCCLLMASTASAQDSSHFGRYLAGLVVCQIADNVTTQMAMSPYMDAQTQTFRTHGEFNPILSSDRGANAVAQAGATVLAVVILRRLEPSHPKMARSVSIGLMALGAVDSVRNLSVYARDRRF